MTSITLENVSVSFPIYDASNRSLKRHLFSGNAGGRIRSDGDSQKIAVVQALDGVTGKLKHGDRVGLVGHNGAGKTTLLRVLAGIYEPVRGTVRVDGQVAPLFDITLGMDPDATGYDNIELRGLFLGMTRKEIRAKTDEIAEFTELGDFLELPIRTYSTGMRMRLAFAVSTSVDPDILLLDEGIGAGDAAFLEKAQKRLKEFTSKAGIIVLASHSDVWIRNICKTAVLLEHGKLVLYGKVETVLDAYRKARTASAVGGGGHDNKSGAKPS